MPVRPYRPTTHQTPDGSMHPYWWSAPFGVWLGVPLRLHVTLVLVAVVAAGYAVETSSFQVALALAVYLASLLAHEAAHCVAAWRVGGGLDQVVVGPVGGLSQPRLPNDPEARVFVAMAGPMANLAIVVLGTCCLAMHNEPALLSLFVPSLETLHNEGQAAADRPVLTLARLAVWVNWPLFVLNLLPAFPFDMGEVARSLLWPWLGQKSSSILVGRLGYVVGLLCLFTAPAIYSSEDVSATRLVLMILGVVVCFGAHRDLIRSQHEPDTSPRTARGPVLGDESDAFDDFWLDDQDDQMVLVELKQRRADQPSTPAPHGVVEESLDEERLDEILAKLYEKGIENLSDDERGLLQRASEKYRGRQPSRFATRAISSLSR